MTEAEAPDCGAQFHGFGCEYEAGHKTKHWAVDYENDVEYRWPSIRHATEAEESVLVAAMGEPDQIKVGKPIDLTPPSIVSQIASIFAEQLLDVSEEMYPQSGWLVVEEVAKAFAMIAERT